MVEELPGSDKHPSVKRLAVDVVLAGAGLVAVVAVVLWVVNAFVGLILWGVKIVAIVAVVVLIARLLFRSKRRGTSSA